MMMMMIMMMMMMMITTTIRDKSIVTTKNKENITTFQYRIFSITILSLDESNISAVRYSALRTKTLQRELRH
jgi:hypothetical protein